MGKSYKVGLLLVVSMFLVSVIQPVAAQGSGSVSSPRAETQCANGCISIIDRCLVWPIYDLLDATLYCLQPLITNSIVEFMGRNLIGIMYSVMAPYSGTIISLLDHMSSLLKPLFAILAKVPVFGPTFDSMYTAFLIDMAGLYRLILGSMGVIPEIMWGE